MAKKKHRDPLAGALSDLRTAKEPLVGLDAARRLREAAEKLEVDLAASSRASGVSWAKIGALYGMTKQGAQQRFGDQNGSGKSGKANRDKDPVAADPEILEPVPPVEVIDTTDAALA